MRVPVLRVPADHRARSGRRRAAQPGPRPTLSADSLRRLPVGHLAWCGAVLLAAGLLVALELAAACPPGGPLAFGSCTAVRPLAVATVGLAAVLYVVGLTAVRWWTAGLQARGVADATAARDWYLLAAGLGLFIAPLLAFTLVSALR